MSLLTELKRRNGFHAESLRGSRSAHRTRVRGLDGLAIDANIVK
jgi:hypothetical protein